MSDKIVKIRDDKIKFNRVEAHWGEVYRKGKSEIPSEDPAELGYMRRVDKMLYVSVDLDLPDGEWQRKVEHFVYFNNQVYRVNATNSDSAVIALIKLGFIGTQRYKGVENDLYEGLLSGKYKLFRIQDIDDAQMIVHCYGREHSSSTRAQYIVTSGTSKIRLADHIETHFIVKELGK